MKKLGILTFIMLLSLLVVNSAQAKSRTLPVTITGTFQGQPQFHAPEIFNSGDVTLTAQLNGSAWNKLDDGTVHIQMNTGTVHVINGNNWRPTNTPGEYTWTQYLPPYVVRIWIENPQTQVEWQPFGPFTIHEGGGYFMSSPVTQIQLDVLAQALPLQADISPEVWVWRVDARPQWAADQWPWWNQVTTSIFTNCPDNLTWTGNIPGLINYSMPTNMTAEITELEWYINHPQGGWSQLGATKGPTCRPIRNK